MDSNQKQRLLDKYWKAETSNDEESVLKGNFYELDNSEKEYFKILNQLEESSLDESFDEALMHKINTPRKISGWAVYKNNYKLMAASIVILMVSVLLVFNLKKDNVTPLAAEDDPKKAFEMTKQALMMISSRLNKGTDYTNELVKFDQAKTKINKLEN